MNPVAVRFGKNLRSCRKRAELSQEDLGYRCSLHRTEIGLLERGVRIPRIDTVIKLACGLAVPPSELLSGIDWNPGSVEPGAFGITPPEEEG